MLIAVFFSRCRQAMSSRCLIDAACACDDRQRDRNLPRRFPQSSRPFNPDGSLRDWIREFTIRKRRGPIPGESNFNKPIRFSPYPYRARNLVECAFVSQRAEASSLTCLAVVQLVSIRRWLHAHESTTQCSSYIPCSKNIRERYANRLRAVGRVPHQNQFVEHHFHVERNVFTRDLADR